MKINKTNTDSLASWCKWLEVNFSPDKMIPMLPVIIRLAGNGFSKWTKGLEKPFDLNLVKLMQETTAHLVKVTNAVVGYTQSDEITLILYSDDRNSSIYHEGKKQKILSKLTGECVNFFNTMRKEYLPDHNKIANFDCRIYQTPTLNDATLQLLWREIDATRNSILVLAQTKYKQKQMDGIDTNKLQDMLMRDFEINWNDLPANLKRGTYIKRQVVRKKLTPDEFDKLPEKHLARRNPDLEISRSIIQPIEYPKMSSIGNRVEVIFQNEEPKLHELI